MQRVAEVRQRQLILVDIATLCCEMFVLKSRHAPELRTIGYEKRIVNVRRKRDR